MSWTERNLAVQGYCISSQESHALRWGVRFPTPTPTDISPAT
ncbi:MAG: hypothetical protein ACJ75Z_08090 [Solirubrobacterales bacterium]